jgi:hypothetical protein
MSGVPYKQESSNGFTYCLSPASRLAPDPSKRSEISQYPDCAAVDDIEATNRSQSLFRGWSEGRQKMQAAQLKTPV